MMNTKSETKAATKTAETKAAAVKTEEVKTADKKPVKAAPSEAKKAPAKTAAKPAAEKKAAPKKTAARKPAAKKEVQSSVIIQYAGKQIIAKEVLEAAKAAYESMNKGAAIETIEIYVKPEENAAYYVVNGEGSDQYKITL